MAAAVAVVAEERAFGETVEMAVMQFQVVHRDPEVVRHLHLTVPVVAAVVEIMLPAVQEPEAQAHRA